MGNLWSSTHTKASKQASQTWEKLRAVTPCHVERDGQYNHIWFWFTLPLSSRHSSRVLSSARMALCFLTVNSIQSFKAKSKLQTAITKFQSLNLSQSQSWRSLAISHSHSHSRTPFPLQVQSSTVTLHYSPQFPPQPLYSPSNPNQPLLLHSLVTSVTAAFLLSPPQSAKTYQTITESGSRSRIRKIEEEPECCSIRRRLEDLTGSAISATRRFGSSTGFTKLAAPSGRSRSSVLFWIHR